jgi:phospholipid/cholesterol/gamma-HCH transport system substrate-binding protein
MPKYQHELSVGIFVFTGLLCLAYLTVRLGSLEFFRNTGYTLTASFNSVSGLREGSSVEIAGVTVGKVSLLRLEPENSYRARIEMWIDDKIRIGDDVIASIKTHGLIGDKFVNLSPGASTIMLQDGDEIIETTPMFDLEGLIGKFIAPGGMN